ncbi:hypothetical protein C0Q70_15613 [Pomacea canaliculata]|uniref:Glycosyl hydrolase family 31 C-terminal domain-containing protein n=1 Tax=Pomacea canaliculata TaxID=400727 RepID=A0A2T7NVC8_POMCA|nr:hypothetical protein C0Q70_15613 [Pomacea canaliculata]
MQMAAFFPAFKFSWAPWSQSEDALNQAKNLSLLHSTLVMSTIQSEKVARDVGAGLPILRPAWWLDPANQTVHAMGLKDEFLVGDELLVAPILCEGVTVRDIYVPPGVWGDRLKNNILVQGPKILYNYRIELNEVAYFVRMKVYNGKELDNPMMPVRPLATAQRPPLFPEVIIDNTQKRTNKTCQHYDARTRSTALRHIVTSSN